MAGRIPPEYYVTSDYDKALEVMEAQAEASSRKARRERIATAALTGLVIQAGIAPDQGPYYASQCLILADALIAELDKEQ